MGWYDFFQKLTNGIFLECDRVKQTVVETEEQEEQRAAKEWLDDGRKGRTLLRRSECILLLQPPYRTVCYRTVCYRTVRYCTVCYRNV